MKRTMAICLTLLICLSVCATAFAVEQPPIQPKGVIGLSSGLPKVAGTTRQYNPWASAMAGLPEQISVGFTLYKMVNGEEVYITSASNSGYTSYVDAEDFVNLTPGTYRLYAYYVGETNSDGSRTTYIIK